MVIYLLIVLSTFLIECQQCDRSGLITSVVHFVNTGTVDNTLQDKQLKVTHF